MFPTFLWAACGPTGPVELARVEGAPTAGSAPSRSAVNGVSPTALSLLDGVVAAATSSGLAIGSHLPSDALAPVPVQAAAGEPSSTGAVTALVRRSPSGVLVASQNGLFHANAGLLYPSPLTQSLGGAQVRTLDAFGSGAAEELWLTTDRGVLHVGGGELTTVSLEGVTALPDAAVGVGPGQALLTVQGSAYSIDLGVGSRTQLAAGLGVVHGFDRGDDGTVFLATDVGLLQRTPEGAASLRTFAPAGQKSPGVVAVAAAFGRLMVIAKDQLVRIEGSEVQSIQTLAAPSDHGLALDAQGDAWVLDGAQLFRVHSGAPVSFETNAKPFFTAHCMGCHRTGTNHAPVLNLESFPVAKQYASTIITRLRAVGTSPMPPPNVEVLNASDYAVVTRWVGGGMQP